MRAYADYQREVAADVMDRAPDTREIGAVQKSGFSRIREKPLKERAE
jgi:hypothetical protein